MVSLEIGSLSYLATELSHFRDLKTGGPKKGVRPLTS